MIASAILTRNGRDGAQADKGTFGHAADAIVRCSPSLDAAVREALRERPDLSIEADEKLGTGFVVIGDGGSVLVDGCLETRLERLSPTLAIEIHSRLEET